MRLVDIRTYPVKALRGTSFDRGRVEPWGLAGDRRWMVVDETGKFVTQRAYPAMALIEATATDAGLRLVRPSGTALDIPFPTAEAPVIDATVFSDIVPARVASNAATDLLSRAIGLPCRLVWLHDTAARATDPAYAPAGSTVSLSDGFPVLLASLDSLADLNRRLPSPITINRFRPNLVVEGADSWAEDGWTRIRIGEVTFAVVKACARCIVTTIDPETGERPDKTEPLRTLGRFRRSASSGAVLFGQNLVPENEGWVRTGDAVEILGSGAPNVTLVPETREGYGTTQPRADAWRQRATAG